MSTITRRPRLAAVVAASPPVTAPSAATDVEHNASATSAAWSPTAVDNAGRSKARVLLRVVLCDPQTAKPPTPDALVSKMSSLLLQWASRASPQKDVLVGAAAAPIEAYVAFAYHPDTGVLRLVEVARGTSNSVDVPPAAITNALQDGELFLGGFHNHPKGQAPSPADALAARSLNDAFAGQRTLSLAQLVVAHKAGKLDVRTVLPAMQSQPTTPFREMGGLGRRRRATNDLSLRGLKNEAAGEAFFAVGDDILQCRGGTGVLQAVVALIANTIGLGSALASEHRKAAEQLQRALPVRDDAEQRQGWLLALLDRYALMHRVPNGQQLQRLRQVLVGPTVDDGDNDWGLRGLRDNDDAFDAAYLAQLFTANDADIPDAQCKFDAAWRRLAPANVDAPFLYTDTGSAANSAMFSLAGLVADHRRTLRGEPAAKDSTPRMLFFDGVYGAGMGAASGMAITAPWSPGGKRNLEADRIPNPAASEWPISSATAARLKPIEDQALAFIERELQQTSDQTVGALFIEPIQAFNNVSFYRPEFIHQLRVLADKYQVPIIADEIFTGGGRTGRFFGYEHYKLGNIDFTPDIVMFGKTLQVCGAAAVTRPTTNTGPAPLSFLGHGDWQRHLGDEVLHRNPHHLLKGAAVLSAIADRNLVQNAAHTGELLQRKLRAVTGYAHGAGLLLAVPDGAERPFVGTDTTSAVGIRSVVHAASCRALQRICPLLDITPDEVIQRFQQPKAPPPKPSQPTPSAATALDALAAEFGVPSIAVAETAAPQAATDVLSPADIALAVRATRALVGPQPATSLATACADLLLALQATPPPPAVGTPSLGLLAGDPLLVTARRVGLEQAGVRHSNYEARDTTRGMIERAEDAFYLAAGMHPLFTTALRATAYDLIGTVASQHARARSDNDTTNGVVLRFDNVAPPDFGILATPDPHTVLKRPANAAEEEAMLDGLRERLAEDKSIGAIVINTTSGIATGQAFGADFLLELSVLAMEHDVALVADESDTAGGLTGQFFHYQQSCLSPSHVLFGGVLGTFGIAARTTAGLRKGGALGLTSITVDSHVAHTLMTACEAIHTRKLCNNARAIEAELRNLLPDALGQHQLAGTTWHVEGATLTLVLPRHQATQMGARCGAGDPCVAMFYVPLTSTPADTRAWLARVLQTRCQ